MATITVKDLIARNKQEREHVTKTVYIPSLDGEITIQSASDDDLRRYDDFLAYEYARSQDQDEMKTQLKRLVYNNVIDPNLKADDLSRALKVKDKLDVVDEIFQASEVLQLVSIILKISGRENAQSVRLVEDLKN